MSVGQHNSYSVCLQLYFVSVITLHVINESKDNKIRNRVIEYTSITIMKVSSISLTVVSINSKLITSFKVKLIIYQLILFITWYYY